jgi:ribonuclease D
MLIPQTIISQLLPLTVIMPKIGLSLHDDIISLHKRAEFKPGNLIDLQKHVGEIGVEDLSLQKLYANFFGLKISKAQRLTNWEADILTDKQKVYAATDAWACIKLYDELMRLERNKDFELRIVKPAEETVEAMAKKQA